MAIIKSSNPGRDFGLKLVEAGIVPKNARRVVIDLPVDGRMVLYVECYGDERILELGTDDLKNAIVVRTVAKVGDTTPDGVPIRPCLKCDRPKPINEFCPHCGGNPSLEQPR
jgi:hypothetical protein